jgi:hypothetical protein
MLPLLSQTISHHKILNYLGANLIGEVYIAEDGWGCSDGI